MIFISGLTEIDAVMGNDEKLIQDIEEAARELKPKFIALAGSPIPFMNGTDFPAIAEILEQDLGIPSFSVPTNGMHDYVYGAGMALAEIAKRIPDEKESIKDLKPGCQYNKGDNEEKTLQERKVEKRLYPSGQWGIHWKILTGRRRQKLVWSYLRQDFVRQKY